MKNQNKACILTAIKGIKTTPEMLAKINKYTGEPLKEDAVFVRKYILCHNGIDRDIERFSEPLLEDFARTLPGKSFLKVHDTFSLPIGLFFEASTEEMTPEAFKDLSGEDLKLPPGVEMAKVVISWLYILKEDFNEKLMKQIDGGIYRHISIGFKASKLIPVTDADGYEIYREYLAPGSSREASIVYLGAQPGATLIKKPKDAPGSTDDMHGVSTIKEKGGSNEMTLEQLLTKMSKLLDKNIDESNILDIVKSMQKDFKALSEAKAATETKKNRVAELESKVEEHATKIKTLEPLAEEGKAYREGLVDEYVLNKGKLGDVSEFESAREALKEVVKKYPITHLKTESALLQRRIEEKFPADSQLQGDMTRDKSGKGTPKEGSKYQGKDNPLVPKEDE